jgi:hypothetical protein
MPLDSPSSTKESPHASKTFLYDRLRIAAECPDRPHLAWLEEFLLPGFSALESEAGTCVVTLDIDDRRHAELQHAGALPGPAARAFVFDRIAVDLPRWASRGSTTVLFDADAEVFYCIDESARHVRIVSASRYLSRRLALMRVVREFAMSSSWTSTRFTLHAGAFELRPETGVIVAGPKGAGKTTLLMYALGADGARFISNDRVVVDFGGPRAEARAMPTVVTVGEQTCRRFPEFSERRQSSGYNERLTIHEAGEHPARSQAKSASNLTPAQFSNLLGVTACASAPAHAILFPRLNDEIDGLCAREISPDAARERISAAIFAGSRPQISEVFALPGSSLPPDPGRVRELSGALVSQVRSFDCVLGRSSPRTTEAVLEFLSTLSR